MMAGRLVRYLRTVELVELVHVKGAVGLHDQALAAFEERIVEQSNRIDASGQHFVEYLEVYVGGDAPAGDALLVGQFGGAASAARGASHKFRPTTLRARPKALRDALAKAVAARQPILLHCLVCTPTLAGPAAASSAPPPPARAPAARRRCSRRRSAAARRTSAPTGRRRPPRAQRGAAVGGAGAADHAARPPRWEYTAVQKSFCLYYEATGSVAQLSKAQREEIAGGASPVNYEGKARDEPARLARAERRADAARGTRRCDGGLVAGAARRRAAARVSDRLEPSLSAVGLGDGLGTGGGDDKGAPKKRRGSCSGCARAARRWRRRAGRIRRLPTPTRSRHPSRACAASTSATLRIRWRRTSGRVWLSEADAAWYCQLLAHEGLIDGAGGRKPAPTSRSPSEGAREVRSFPEGEAARVFLRDGDTPRLFEAALGPSTAMRAAARGAARGDSGLLRRSAANLAQLCHHNETVNVTSRAACAPPHPTRSERALHVVRRQHKTYAERLHRAVTRDERRTSRRQRRGAAARAERRRGPPRRRFQTARRLGGLNRSVAALAQVVADTISDFCSKVSEYVQRHAEAIRSQSRWASKNSLREPASTRRPSVIATAR